MTVSELKRQLSAMPSNTEVVFEDTTGGVWSIDIVSIGGGPDGMVNLSTYQEAPR